MKKELKLMEQNRQYYKVVILPDMPRGKGQHSNPSDKYLIKEQELKEMLSYSLHKLQDKMIEFEQFLETVYDSEMRVILRLRCINNMSWNEIGDNTGMDRRTASRRFNKFFHDKKQIVQAKH